MSIAAITVWLLLSQVCWCRRACLGDISTDITTKGWFQSPSLLLVFGFPETIYRDVSVGWWPMKLSQKRKLRPKEVKSLRLQSPGQETAWIGIEPSLRTPAFALTPGYLFSLCIPLRSCTQAGWTLEHVPPVTGVLHEYKAIVWWDSYGEAKSSFGSTGHCLGEEDTDRRDSTVGLG